MINKLKIYIYPIYTLDEKGRSNPYIHRLCNSLRPFCDTVNAITPSRLEWMDLLKFVSAEVYCFNWIEDLPSRRLGKFRVILFAPLLAVWKIFGKKIVWTLHNKAGHAKNTLWRSFMEWFIVALSNGVLTHSSEGVKYFKIKYPRHSHKIVYLPHPVTPSISPVANVGVIRYDFLVWGVIRPYKGLLEFLQNLSNCNIGDDVKICIVGRCDDIEYLEQLKVYTHGNVTHINEFRSLSEIASLAMESRYILFTYKADSILSSGALMDSLSMGRPVIGPNVGAFEDLSRCGLVVTYNDFSDLFLRVLPGLKDMNNFKHNYDKFIDENNWEQFGLNYYHLLRKVCAKESLNKCP